MTEARIIAVSGSLGAALLATWLGYWISAYTMDGPGTFDDPLALWKLWGVPAAVAAGVATFLLTRKSDWLPERWSFLPLTGFALRCAGLACLLYLPVQICCLFMLSLIGGMSGSTGGFGIGRAGILLAYMDALAIACGIVPAVLIQMLVLLLARATATYVERELRSIEEWKRTH